MAFFWIINFKSITYSLIGDFMLNRVKEYINDNEFRLTIFENQIYAINYLRIISLEDEYISLITKKGKVIIKGNNLCLNKLLDNEILISGSVTSIEVDFNE